MKIRESGMPPQGVWDAFFDPDGILDRLGFDDSVTDAVEFGCGYGTFTLPAANSSKPPMMTGLRPTWSDSQPSGTCSKAWVRP